MKILERYILVENIKPFFVSLLVITFIMMLDRIIDLLNLIIEKKLDIVTIVSLFGLSLPFILALSVPMAVLTATIMAFGRLSVDNEMTAMKSCGINTFTLMKPLILATLMLCGLMIYFNNSVLPETNHALKKLLVKVSYRRPTTAIKPGTFTTLRDFTIYVKESNEKELRGIIIYNRENSRFPKTITAKSGQITLQNGGNSLVATLYDGEMHDRDEKEPQKYQVRYFKKYTLVLPDLGFAFDDNQDDYRGDREMSSKQMLKIVQDKETEIKNIRKEIAKIDQRMELLPETSRDQFIKKEIKKNKMMIGMKNSQIEDLYTDMRMYQVEIQKKYALAFACFIFFFIGAPIGMMTKTSGIGVSFSVSSLVFLVYYVFIIGGEELSDRGYLSPYIAMWLPDLIFMLIGSSLVWVAWKEKKILDLDKIKTKITGVLKL